VAQEVAQKLTITTLPRKSCELIFWPSMLMKVTSGRLLAAEGGEADAGDRERGGADGGRLDPGTAGGERAVMGSSHP
jgi:hypothetical protein